MGLCVSRAFCGLCGFCTRVELGGLKACSVFASILSFCRLSFVLFLVLLLLCLPPLLVLFPAFPLLSALVSFVVFVVVSFSLSVYTQKERARRVGASSLVLL